MRLLTVPSGTPRRSASSDLGQAAVVGELEGLPLLAGELGQRRLHRGAPVPEHRVLVGRAGDRLGRGLERLAAAALLPAHDVDGPPVHDGEDPRRRLARSRL